MPPGRGVLPRLRRVTVDPTAHLPAPPTVPTPRLASSPEEASRACTTSREAPSRATRHTQHRAPDGSLYAEELFGVEGFTGRSSLLYHVTPPTQTHKLEPGPRIELEAADDGLHRHRLTKTGRRGARRATRSPAVSRCTSTTTSCSGSCGPPNRCPRTASTATAIADEMLFVHEGTGVCRTIFGDLPYHPGDYLVLPIGTTWRLDPDEGSRAADPVPRGAVGDRAAEAVSQRLRPAPGALAVRPARPPRPRVPRARSTSTATT